MSTEPQPTRAGPRVLDRDDTPPGSEAAYAPPRVIERQEVERIDPDAGARSGAREATGGMPVRPRRRRNWPVTLAALGIGLFVAEWVVVGAVNWVAATAEHNPVLGWIAGAGLAAGAAGLLFLLGREARSFLALRRVEALQGQFGAVDRMSIDRVDRFISGMLTALRHRPDSRADVAAFERRIQPQHTPAQRIAILSQTVLRPLDRRAEDAIRAAAGRAFGITAISPTALTHTVFFLVACLRMMREVTAAYGHRPTAATTAHLLRRLVVEVGKIGGIDIAVSAMGTHLLTGLVERVGAGAAESAYAAQRMARLGIITMAMCRPVPFQENEIPSLSSLVGNLVQRG